MTAQELRNSILQLAMQGKLVEQRKEEGTAKELLAQIKTEKKRLLQEKKIKKEKPLPEITESEIPFEIPESWEWMRISELCNMYTGNSISEYEKKNKYMNIEEGYDYIGTKDIHFTNVIEYDNGVKIPYTENFKYAPKNSILLCIEGGSAGKKIGFLDRKVCFGNKLCMINPIGMCNKFIYYQLQAPSFNTTFKGKITGIIGGISIGKLKTLLIAIPPLDEQKRIVAKIEEFFTYIEQYDKAYTRIETFNKKFPTDMRKAILQLAIQGKLVEQREEEGTAEELLTQIKAEKKKLLKEKKIKKEKPLPEITESEIPFEIPKSWEWVRLAEVGEIIGGGTPSTVHLEYWDGEIPWLTPADMKNVIGKYVSKGERNITELGLEKSSARLIPKGSVLYSSRAPIGYIAIAENEIATNQGFKSCVPMKEEMKEYLYYCLISRTGNIKSRASGTTFKEISGSEFGLTIIPLPPLAEQKRIVAKLEQLLPYCECLMK